MSAIHPLPPMRLTALQRLAWHAGYDGGLARWPLGRMCRDVRPPFRAALRKGYKRAVLDR